MEREGERGRLIDCVINSSAFFGGLYISLDIRLFTGCPEFGELVRYCPIDSSLIFRGWKAYRLPTEALKHSSMPYSYLTISQLLNLSEPQP